MEGGYAVATLLLSILAAVIIFSIFPPNLINILLGIILGLLISVRSMLKRSMMSFKAFYFSILFTIVRGVEDSCDIRLFRFYYCLNK
jgi:uncharacterized membrane protein